MTSVHVFTLAFFILAAIKVSAQEDREAFKAAFDACVTETGVPQARGVRPSDEDREKLSNCLASKGYTRPSRPSGGGYAGGGENDSVVREAMKACATENNLSRPGPGTPPSEEDRQKMEACLAEKGLSMPQRPEGTRIGHGHYTPPSSHSGRVSAE